MGSKDPKADKKKKRIDDGIGNHEPDQQRAKAHELIDETKVWAVQAIKEDGSICRLLYADDADIIALIGLLRYQAHRLEIYLDDTDREEEEEDDDDAEPDPV